MTARLHALLRQIVLPGEPQADALAWDQMLVMSNVGRIPAPVSMAGDFLWNRGFHVLLLDRAGEPAYLCKCRGADDRLLKHETEVRARLCADARLRHVIPWTTGAENDEIQVQVSRYVDGPLYAHLVPSLSLAAWAASMRAILDGARLACRTYDEGSGAASVSIRRPLDVAAPFLPDLAGAGISSTAIASLRTWLEQTPPFRPMTQHGDLWPRNIVHDGASWWLLDFEYVGETRVPLYDVYQLVRTCVLMRHRTASGEEPTWFDCMSSGDVEARAARDVVRDAAGTCGLSESQAMGCLACYLIEITGRLLRRRAPSRFCVPFVSELERVGAAIRDGADMNAVFWRN